jgi:hypothetical protein
VPAEFGRKNRQRQDVPAAPAMSIKRSSNISLIVMGALAFTASFAGGSAYMGWQQPTQTQNCTTAADGKQVCPTRRSWIYLPAFHYWGWGPGERSASAAPRTQSTNTNARLATGAPLMNASGGTRAVEGTTRGGFGASGRTAFRGSAAG